MKQLNFDLSTKPPKISQWFVSLEGEGDAVGTPAAYIRYAGCYSAACKFCDTKYSWGNAPSFKDIDDPDLSQEIKKELTRISPVRLTLTGGEPLHYMHWFPTTFRWINSLSPKPLNYFGIESNGNLLQNSDYNLKLISSFNRVIREFGVVPVLTISPKIDAATCYKNQITQSEVDRMYFDTFSNTKDYMQAYPIFYKFIYDFTDEIIPWKHTYQFIEYLLKECKVKQNHILLMPLTPDDPLDKDSAFWTDSKDATARQALNYGLTYSPRIHVDRRLD